MSDDPPSRGGRRTEEILNSGTDVPLRYPELRERAKEALDPGPEAFLFSGSGLGETMKSNRRAFADVKIRPRVLRDVSSRSLSVDLYDSTLSAPVVLAPIGAQSIWHERGELASARGATDADVPCCLSTLSTASLEDVAAEAGEQERWFQLYWLDDRAVLKSLLERAENAGYGAIVLTVDTPVMGWRTRILESGYIPFDEGIRLENFVTDPAFRETLETPPEEDISGVRNRLGEILNHQDLTWDDLEWLRDQTDLPVLLKGIRHPEDAEKAASVVDGVVVSNHGGRQVDGERGTLEALPEIVDVVDGDVPILFDGGVRTGADVFKAVALGADAVLLGRLYIYGLSVAGAEGVRQTVENVIGELDLTMGLSGYDDITEVDRQAIDVRL